MCVLDAAVCCFSVSTYSSVWCYIYPFCLLKRHWPLSSPPTTTTNSLSQLLARSRSAVDILLLCCFDLGTKRKKTFTSQPTAHARRQTALCVKTIEKHGFCTPVQCKHCPIVLKRVSILYAYTIIVFQCVSRIVIQYFKAHKNNNVNSWLRWLFREIRCGCVENHRGDLGTQTKS